MLRQWWRKWIGYDALHHEPSRTSHTTCVCGHKGWEHKQRMAGMGTYWIAFGACNVPQCACRDLEANDAA